MFILMSCYEYNIRNALILCSSDQWLIVIGWM